MLKTALLLLTVSPLVAAADPWTIVPSASSGVEAFHYAELDANQNVLDSQDAALPTARVEVEASSPHGRVFVRGSIAWTSGTMSYVGGTQNFQTGAITPDVGPSSNSITDTDVVVGVRGHLGRAVMLGGFAGFGHHSWQRDLRPVDPGSNTGYLEDYEWSYAQLGARLDATPHPRVHLIAEATLLSPAIGDLAITHQQNGVDDASLQIGFATGTRVRLVAAYEVVPKVWLSATGVIETDAITQSSAAPLMVGGTQLQDSKGNPLFSSEPQSETTRMIVNVGAGYAF